MLAKSTGEAIGLSIIALVVACRICFISLYGFSVVLMSLGSYMLPRDCILLLSYLGLSEESGFFS